VLIRRRETQKEKKVTVPREGKQTNSAKATPGRGIRYEDKEEN